MDAFSFFKGCCSYTLRLPPPQAELGRSGVMEKYISEALLLRRGRDADFAGKSVMFSQTDVIFMFFFDFLPVSAIAFSSFLWYNFKSIAGLGNKIKIIAIL